MSCTAGNGAGVSGRGGTPAGKPPSDDGMWSTTDEQPGSTTAAASHKAAAPARADREVIAVDMLVDRRALERITGYSPKPMKSRPKTEPLAPIDSAVICPKQGTRAGLTSA